MGFQHDKAMKLRHTLTMKTEFFFFCLIASHISITWYYITKKAEEKNKLQKSMFAFVFRYPWRLSNHCTLFPIFCLELHDPSVWGISCMQISFYASKGWLQIYNPNEAVDHIIPHGNNTWNAPRLVLSHDVIHVEYL